MDGRKSGNPERGARGKGKTLKRILDEKFNWIPGWQEASERSSTDARGLFGEGKCPADYR